MCDQDMGKKHYINPNGGKTPGKVRIGLLEDDTLQRRILGNHLRKWDSIEAEVVPFDSASSLLRTLKEQLFDAMVIDWRLPDSDGMTITRTLREEYGFKGPILIITADQDESAVLQAIEAGANDLIHKPVNPAVLRARIFSWLRATTSIISYSDATYEIGPYQLTPKTQSMSVHGDAISLTSREYALAYELFSNPGRIIPRGYLLESIWGMKDNPTTRTIDTHASRLRKKLGLNGRNGYRLRCLKGRGYKLEVPAELSN